MAHGGIPGGSINVAIQVHGVAPLLQVFHMPTAVRFWRDVLGFEVTGRSQKVFSDDLDDVGWVMLELGGACVMLNTAYDLDETPDKPDAARWEGHGDTCLYFDCPDVDGAYAHLVSKGVEVKPPQVAWYGMKQLYVTAPDGFGICFQCKT